MAASAEQPQGPPRSLRRSRRRRRREPIRGLVSAEVPPPPAADWPRSRGHAPAPASPPGSPRSVASSGSPSPGPGSPVPEATPDRPRRAAAASGLWALGRRGGMEEEGKATFLFACGMGPPSPEPPPGPAASVAKRLGSSGLLYVGGCGSPGPRRLPGCISGAAGPFPGDRPGGGAGFLVRSVGTIHRGEGAF